MDGGGAADGGPACAQVTGDTVANMDLRRAVEAHRARREKDKLAIMTMASRGWDCDPCTSTMLVTCMPAAAEHTDLLVLT